MYRYHLTTTGDNSNHYGPCDICGGHCSEVFHQVEERSYKRDKLDRAEGFKGIGWTHHNCNDYFGHKDCLEGKQRNEAEKAKAATLA